ncbi:MAG TPA: pitrilysin family protein [Salinarimonas sp.]|jgi:zinc protease|nr:pitrilysin family protein [Salinarimonas sp.]
MRRFVLLPCVLSFLLACAAAVAQQPAAEPPPDAAAPDARPQEVRISDRVVLVRDPSMRTVQFTMVVRAGCADEPGLRCRGVAHFLEHLVAARRNADHSEAVSAFFPDGTSNAWTSHRATGYVHRLPRRASTEADLERLFGFYAGKLRGFEATPEDAARERNIVLQEYHVRVSASPFARFQARLEGVLLPDHPLGRFVGGTPETIAELTLEDARAFHKAWYAINNAFFVVAGDVSELALKAIVEKTLSGLPEQPLPERGWRALFPVEPLDATIREASDEVRRRSVSAARLVRLEDDDPTLRPARELLSSFLRSQLPGSPHDFLVEREGVTDAVGFADVTRLVPGIYRATLAAEPHDETDPDRLAAAMRAYWGDLAARGIDARNLERLKKRHAESLRLAERQGDRVYARVVDWLGVGNEYDTLAVWPRRIAAVTVDDVNRLIRAVAGSGREVTGILVPGEGKAP